MNPAISAIKKSLARVSNSKKPLATLATESPKPFRSQNVDRMLPEGLGVNIVGGLRQAIGKGFVQLVRIRLCNLSHAAAMAATCQLHMRLMGT